METFYTMIQSIKVYGAEFVGFPYTVCNLGSVNLYNMLENNQFNYDKLKKVTEIGAEYLNYALWANDYPLKQLTEESQKYRPIGLGFMGLASTFMKLGYKYGDENSKLLAKYISETMMYSVIKVSHNLLPILGTFYDYEKSTYAKGEFKFKNDLYGKEIKELLKSGVVNSRFMAIAPTGSISMIAAALSSEAAVVSGGIEPIFALSYKRQVNPNTSQAYLVDQDDIALIPTLLSMGYSKKEAKELISNIGTNKQDAIFNNPRFTTSGKLSVKEHMDILEIVSNAIDMSVSKTINVPEETTPEQIADIYLEFISRNIKGGTVYRSGSRQAILKEKKEEDKKKEEQKKLGVFIADLSFNKKGKIEPKKRPILMEAIKKTIKYKDNGDIKIFHIDVGFTEDAEPFEIFIRATQSTKEYAEFFNGIGRLMSLAFRSNLSIDETLEQVRKIKNYKNEYSEIAKMIVETVNEMVEVRKAKGKKKQNIIENINEKEGWIRTAKGYYLDKEGKMRCPVCGGEVIAESGCFSCKNGDWNACN